MTDATLTPEILARQLQDVAQKNAMPDWLKTNILTMAENAAMIMPEQQEEDLPVFIYFH